jgi:hypothetical protein
MRTIAGWKDQICAAGYLDRAALEGAIDAAEPDLARGPSSDLMVPLNFAPETSHGSPLLLANLIVMAETRLFQFRVIADDL